MKKGSRYNPSGSHLNEHIFRKYEDFFVQLLACYPNPLTLHPTNIAASTFRQQIRVAANALLQHGYPSSVTPEALSPIWNSVVVIIHNDHIVIGPRASVTEAIRATETSTTPPSFLCELTNPTLAQLNALRAMYESGASVVPSRIVGEIPPGYEHSPLVTLQPQPDGSHLML